MKLILYFIRWLLLFTIITGNMNEGINSDPKNVPIATPPTLKNLSSRIDSDNLNKASNQPTIGINFK